ncbi:MAG TPA: primosomal protein N', partial [Rhabdaerophilum sp.]|nr:primosomal protein N' [Rhabdaerophilum sp.]
MSRSDDSPADAAAAPNVAEVALPLGIDRPYSYLIPAGLDIAAGDCVRVPLGTRESYGVVVEARVSAAASNLKPVLERTRLPPLSPAMLKFVARVSDYTLAPIGMVARMAIRDPEAESHEAPRFGVRL